MPHGAVVLADGANENRTPALNQFGLSYTQLVRYQFDNQGLVLCQKLGGWQKQFPNTMTAIVRALWAWQDINAVKHLAFGTQNISTSAQLGVITNGALQDITPTSTTDNVTPAASAISGSAVVTITDATTMGITSFDSVFIETHVSVGGLVLYGLYACTQISNTTYSVTATDILGNPLLATASTTTTTVASFATTSGSNVITVTLASHGYSPASTYPCLVSTTVGGVTLYGDFVVQTVPSSSTFTILAPQTASSSTSGSINGGNARYLYSYGIGAIPAGTGYGIGGYGSGGYGTGTGVIPAVGTPISATNWTLDNWGEILLACPINGTLFQPIYTWDPLSGAPIATVISAPGAPTINDGFFVSMPERQIVVWGTTETGIQDPLLLRWCDVNNFNTWVDLPTNQAGSFRLTSGSRIVGAIQGPQQGLIWTDIDLWSMQYINLPNVYGFNKIGTGCGMISRKAAASVDGIIYWMGPSQFFTLSGDGVQPMSCPIWDVMFQDLDQSNLDKIRVAVNSRFNEIAWYFPTMSSGGEVNSFVKYSYGTGFWDYGNLGRSAWIDQSVLGDPIGADPASLYIYQHEVSNDADGSPLVASFQTGYFAIQEGDLKVFIDQLWPDARFGDFGSPQNATLQITFYVVDYPGQTPTVYGPFTFTQATTFLSPRIRGRLVSIAMGSSDLGSFWRIGRFRYRFAPDGKY